MAATVRKGAPSKSYPSRQKKLGPAPFASFEDLSDEIDQDLSEQDKIKPLPEIKEDGSRSPEEIVRHIESPSSKAGGASQTVCNAPYSMPASGHTSGLQTPSTPRIDISCASSGTPPSEDSNSERELFKGGLGFAFHEEGAEDLRSSTEELDLGEDDLEDESSKPKNEKLESTEEFLRRASHPANIFARKASTTVSPDEEHFNRKPSAHSLYLDGYLSRPVRHHSFGSGDYNRPGALSSLSNASGRRSASPHKMLLETSFCGSKPIPTLSIDLEFKSDPTLKEQQQDKEISDSSLEEKVMSGTTTLTTVQVHHHDNRIVQVPQQLNCSIKESTAPLKPYSPGSPKSSDHWKPISPKTPHSGNKIVSSSDSPNTNTQVFAYPTPGPSPNPSGFYSTSKGCVPVHEAKWERANRTSELSAVIKETIYQEYQKETSSCDVFQLQPGQEKEKAAKGASSKSSSPPKAPSSPTSSKPRIVKEERKNFNAAIQSKTCVQVTGKQILPLESLAKSVVSDSEELTTELTISEDPVVTVEDVPIETKGFFLQESPEDGDLPYVPTTLPLEKSVVVPIVPIKERRKLNSMVATTPVQRPRCVRPPNPASINDYISKVSNKVKDSSATETKMKINLPREDSIPDSVPARPKSPKKKLSTSWTDFAELGLRSPREIRRRMKEENGAIDELNSYQSDSSQDTAGPVNESDDETEALLKLPKVPFAMDLDVQSNRSSVAPSPHDDIPNSPLSTASPDLPRKLAQLKK